MEEQNTQQPTKAVDVSAISSEESINNLLAANAADQSGRTALELEKKNLEMSTGLSADSFDTPEKRQTIVNTWTMAQQNAARGDNFIKKQQLLETQRKYGITGAVAVAQQEDFALKERQQMESIRATVAQNAAAQFANLVQQEGAIKLSSNNAARDRLAKVIEDIGNQGKFNAQAGKEAKDLMAEYGDQLRSMNVNYEQLIDDAISSKQNSLDIAARLRGDNRTSFQRRTEIANNWGYNLGQKIGSHTLDRGDTEWFNNELAKGRDPLSIATEGYQKYDYDNSAKLIRELIAQNKIK